MQSFEESFNVLEHSHEPRPTSLGISTVALKLEIQLHQRLCKWAAGPGSWEWGSLWRASLSQSSRRNIFHFRYSFDSLTPPIHDGSFIESRRGFIGAL
jgi:hypothetical protein